MQISDQQKKTFQGFLKGNIDNIGKELLNQAGTAVMGAAKEFIGQAINEMFIVKKEAPSKRVLPSIQNMKIVSFFDACSFTNEHK